MLRAEMSEARMRWLDTIKEPQVRIERDSSDFLKPIDSQGEHLDFHSLRHSTASWLNAAGAARQETIAYTAKPNEKAGETQEPPGFISRMPPQGLEPWTR